MAGRCAALLLGAVVLAGPGTGEAQVYRWVDEAGAAHYAEGIDSVPERYRSRATPLTSGVRSGPVGPPATAPAAAGTPRASGSATIPFTAGERILVDALINGTTPVRLELDTGAGRTLISPRALVAAGVSLTRDAVRGQVIGVTGRDDVHLVVVDALEVGEARVGRLAVMAYEMAAPGGDGLLGRDFLGQFSVTIDPARGLVTLSPK